VALKRQQAAEDAVALGLRTIATGASLRALPPGPIFGMKIADSEEPPTETTASSILSDSNKQTLRDRDEESASNEIKVQKSSSEKVQQHHQQPQLQQPLMVPTNPGYNEKTKTVTSNHPHGKRSSVHPHFGHQHNNTIAPTSTPAAKEVLRKLFPTYDETLLDKVLTQNDHSLIKTIQKIGSHHSHFVTHGSKSGHSGQK